MRLNNYNQTLDVMKKLNLTFTLVLSLISFMTVANNDGDKKSKEATIYLIRYGVAGAGMPTTIDLNKQYVGSTVPYSYIQMNVAPGKHQISANYRNRYTVEMTVEAGETYYLRQYITPGVIVPGTKIEQIDDKQGLDLLNKNKPLSDKRNREKIVNIDN